MTGYQETLDAWRRATAAALEASEARFRAEWGAIAESRFRTVWEGTAEAMILTDPDGIVLAVNPAFCTLYGREAPTLIGHSFARHLSRGRAGAGRGELPRLLRRPRSTPHLRIPVATP